MSFSLRKLFDKVLSRYVSTGLVFALDVFLSILSAGLVAFGVHYLANYYHKPMLYWNQFVWVWLAASTVSAIFMFWLFKSYRVIIRHSSRISS